MQLPGLIDIHVHLREPGATHKEDWDTGTSAALAGGFTTVLAMPNTQPPVTDAASLDLALNAARRKARCDYGQYLGAGPDNVDLLPDLAPRSTGLKMYLDQTYGSLRLDDMTLWMRHFAHWPRSRPIAAHAEGRTLAAVILMAQLYDRSVHLCHVSRREEILLIKAAKEKGIKVTCEVTPHHLFLSQTNLTPNLLTPNPLIPNLLTPNPLTPNRLTVRPHLASQADVDALWDNLDVIDCFATDHAPHTLAEKDSDSPPPGFPGLETALPLLLTAVHEGRLTLDDVVARMYTNPRQIFNLPAQPETWVEVDLGAEYHIRAAESHSKCGWTPFEGRRVRGRVARVILRGQEVFRNGRILASSGYGRLGIRDWRLETGD